MYPTLVDPGYINTILGTRKAIAYVNHVNDLTLQSVTAVQRQKS